MTAFCRGFPNGIRSCHRAELQQSSNKVIFLGEVFPPLAIVSISERKLEVLLSHINCEFSLHGSRPTNLCFAVVMFCDHSQILSYRVIKDNVEAAP